ncbi:Dimethylaniline monooxygenase [N-oxide-forming] 2 [Araneus ventricosus]|uniref:Flavin-containing monooxygenase n=1 Tax=Araneus ventricosus TaxID=182803 RepID=A0A4Y2C3J8_ARAVE|nr:Dimethylaniline monooxygenase [N-oxide-forming] 2 [Araneus ventricosus]
MDPSPKRIAILGGGFAGMCSIASLIEEGGFEPVCFEKTNKPGGTWCYRDEAIEGVASIMPTTIINHSKEIGALSNYPPPRECSNFMRHKELYQNVIDGAKDRDLLKYIHCNTEVISVKRADDYELAGRWTVAVKNTISGAVSTNTYDGVLVCVGHINRPKMPSFPGQDSYKGQIIHTHSLRGVEPYRNKTVVVVGMGCSGLDAAVEISNVAEQVYLSTRSGAHVLQRVGPHGYPYDYVLLRRCIFFWFDILPPNIVSWLLESLYLDPQFNHNIYAVKPTHHIFSKDPVINDYITSKLLSGSVKQKPNIKKFTEDGVIFEGDSEVTKADVVIMATGYTWKFPFLEEDIISEKENKINLYKCMFPINLSYPTLAIIGFVLPFGPGFPVGELQCRWVTQVLAGKCNLPSKEEMIKDINERYMKNVARYAPSEKMSIRVDYIKYCDDIASQFGAKPDFLKILLTDTRLFFHLIFGPSLPYQYRLQGPHSSDGAREAIMTSKKRMMWPITKRNSEECYENILVKIFKKVFRLVFY